MADNKRERCTRCGAVYTEREIEDMSVCVFQETRLEPAEYEVRCATARCGGTYDDFEEFYVCDATGCEDEATHDDLCYTHWSILDHEGTLDMGNDIDGAELMMEER